MDYTDISATEAEEFLNTSSLIVVDMRDRAHYDYMHIPGAHHADDQFMRSLLRQQDRSTVVLIYCYHGNSSRDLAKFLCRLGFAKVYNLVGGWQSWSAHCLSQLPKELHGWLISEGFDSFNLNGFNEEQLSPLMVAARQGNLYMVNQLLEAGAQVDLENKYGYTALWYACLSNEIKIVNLLINNNAELNHKSQSGTTPLIYAASVANLDIVMALVSAGADLHAQSHAGHSALDMAGSVEIINILKPLSHPSYDHLH